MSDSRLLLISRDDILGVAPDKEANKLFRTLARLTRGDFQLLATAPQPEEWSREHGGPEDVLLGPGSIRKRLADFGGTSYTDSMIDSHVTYYYIVRAEDSTTSGGGPANGGKWIRA